MRLTALLLSALAVTCLGRAQDSFDLQVSNHLLVFMPQLQRELNMTPDMIAGVVKAAKPFNAEVIKAKNDASRVKTLQADARRAVLAKLTPAQLRRLREITLQQYGTQVLATPVIAAKLGLSENQQKSIRNLQVANAKGIMDAYRAEIDAATAELRKQQPKNPGEREMLQRQMADAVEAAHVEEHIQHMRNEGEQRLLTVLTDEQRKAWNSLFGRPFQMGPIAPTAGNGKPPAP
jgi:hypothetical protein